METGSLSIFLAMGGYAAYVWPAFAATAVVLIGLLVISVRDVRCREADLLRLRAEMREDRREPTGEA